MKRSHTTSRTPFGPITRAIRASRLRRVALAKDDVMRRAADADRKGYRRGRTDGMAQMTPVQFAEDRSLWLGEKPHGYERKVAIPRGRMCDMFREDFNPYMQEHGAIATFRMVRKGIEVQGTFIHWADWEVVNVGPM